MVDLLEKCNNTAMALPYNEVVRVVKHQYRKFSKLLDIGTETYFRKNVVFHLEGMWPKYVLLRKALIGGESAILARWTNLLNETFKASSSGEIFGSNEPQGAKLSGNIAVIFTVYAVGISVSIIAMGVLHLQSLTGNLKKIYNCVSNKTFWRFLNSRMHYLPFYLQVILSDFY